MTGVFIYRFISLTYYLFITFAKLFALFNKSYTCNFYPLGCPFPTPSRCAWRRLAIRPEDAVLSRLISNDWMCGAVLACTMLAACGDHDQPAASTSSQSIASTASSSPSSMQQTDASALPGSSDIQRWALQQTQRATSTSSLTQETPPAAASDPLLPPVIHAAE